jgi:hypothetical protein
MKNRFQNLPRYTEAVAAAELRAMKALDNVVGLCR